MTLSGPLYALCRAPYTGEFRSIRRESAVVGGWKPKVASIENHLDLRVLSDVLEQPRGHGRSGAIINDHDLVVCVLRLLQDALEGEPGVLGIVVGDHDD